MHTATTCNTRTVCSQFKSPPTLWCPNSPPPPQESPPPPAARTRPRSPSAPSRARMQAGTSAHSCARRAATAAPRGCPSTASRTSRSRCVVWCLLLGAPASSISRHAVSVFLPSALCLPFTVPHLTLPQPIGEGDILVRPLRVKRRPLLTLPSFPSFLFLASPWQVETRSSVPRRIGSGRAGGRVRAGRGVCGARRAWQHMSALVMGVVGCLV